MVWREPFRPYGSKDDETTKHLPASTENTRPRLYDALRVPNHAPVAPVGMVYARAGK
jgi:hypothetical protein